MPQPLACRCRDPENSTSKSLSSCFRELAWFAHLIVARADMAGSGVGFPSLPREASTPILPRLRLVNHFTKNSLCTFTTKIRLRIANLMSAKASERECCSHASNVPAASGWCKVRAAL